MMTLRSLLFVVVALFIARPSAVFAAEPLVGGAQGTDAQAPAEARERFRQASEAAQAGRWEEALSLYRASAERFPHATTLSNIGYCHERLGDYAAALRDTLAALALGAEQPERALDPELEAKAEAAVAALQGEVGRIRLAPAHSNFEVRVDGQGLRTVSHGGEALSFADDGSPNAFSPAGEARVIVLNPGSHHVEWRRGSASGERSVDVPAGAELELELGLGEAEAPRALATPPVVDSVAPLAPRAPAPQNERAHDGVSAWALGSFVTGTVAFVAGTTAGTVALSAKWNLDERCSEEGRCPPSQSARIERFQTAATVSTLSFGVAALALGTGVVLIVLDGDSKPAHLQVRLSDRLELEGSF